MTLVFPQRETELYQIYIKSPAKCVAKCNEMSLSSELTDNLVDKFDREKNQLMETIDVSNGYSKMNISSQDELYETYLQSESKYIRECKKMGMLFESIKTLFQMFEGRNGIS